MAEAPPMTALAYSQSISGAQRSVGSQIINREVVACTCYRPRLYHGELSESQRDFSDFAVDLLLELLILDTGGMYWPLEMRP